MGETLLLALRVSLSLAVVLALLWFLARRVGSRTDPARRVPITVLGRQSLGRRSGVVVVAVGGRTLLLGVSESTVQLLSEVDAPAADEHRVDDAHRAHDDAHGAHDFATVLDAAQSPAATPTPPQLPPGQHPAPRWSEPATSHRTAHPVDARHRGRRRAAAPTGGTLSGSVLAPSTWSRTWAVLQERSGR